MGSSNFRINAFSFKRQPLKTWRVSRRARNTSVIFARHVEKCNSELWQPMNQVQYF